MYFISYTFIFNFLFYLPRHYIKIGRLLSPTKQPPGRETKQPPGRETKQPPGRETKQPPIATARQIADERGRVGFFVFGAFFATMNYMFFDAFQLEPFLQVILAAGLGAIIGVEREYKRREAGIRTFSLVALGSCFFTVLGIYLASGRAGEGISADPIRIIQAIAIGIGFIGSGLIVYRKFQIEGLTTAAALWAAAAVGIGVGLKLYFLSVLGSFLTISILYILGQAERKFFPSKKDEE